VRALARALPAWASNPQLRTVRVFTLELEHIAILNRALDGRDFTVATHPLEAACGELERELDGRDWPEPVRSALKDLHQIASAPDPSLQSVALEGRRVAETLLGILSREVARPGSLRSKYRFQATLRADRAAPYLQLLLAIGRSAAEGSAAPSDAAMALHAALRAAELAVE
jgi:hypothetical protein